MKRLIIVPKGWPCRLSECPPGFYMLGEELCFKSEYFRDSGRPDAYVSSGEMWSVNDEVIVQPVTAVWEEYDS